MNNKKLPEVWQRGPVAGVPTLLQPVAHALLQANEEIIDLMNGFKDELLYEQPAGLASPAFHLQHLTGVLDRLFTYAHGEMLNDEQLTYLSQEGKLAQIPYTATDLASAFSTQVDKAIVQLRNTDEAMLADFRGVGRAQIPSTVIGLLVHAAEHTMRHTGQLLVTVKILQANL
ncbi:DinB family protein [Mucilaginibacter sp. UR6-1]|uniref:DinB family protein n=1 Tax=Mucilaginibacter sp. UR6-1 TaxID=1435643 RepID=UPI001E594719|nr:DinB family protein [Mucilaginibacter sp. UR6-1]MCC8409052.1 DinB family protein [Mucilaginibacter sp. UR6-1]